MHSFGFRWALDWGWVPWVNCESDGVESDVEIDNVASVMKEVFALIDGG